MVNNGGRIILNLLDDVAEEVIIRREETLLPPKKVKRLGGSYCVAQSCHHNQLRDKDYKYFKFPKKNKAQRDLWIKALNRTNRDGTPWTPTPSSLLCSAHFVSGQWSRNKSDLDYIPTIFMQESSNAKRRKGSHTPKIRSISTQTDIAVVSPDSFVFSCSFDPAIRSAQTQITSKIFQTVSVKTETYHNPVVNASTSTEDCVGIAVETFSDGKLKAFTGINSNFFNTLVYNLSDSLKPSLRLSKKNKILMFLIKLRLGLTFTVISGFFGVTQKVAQFCFTEVMDVFYNFAMSALTWCSKEEIKDRMPMDLKTSLPNCRVVVHCFECETERPKEGNRQLRLHSKSSGRHSVKFLFGLAPHGEITFVSETYGASVNELEIIKKCGILNILESGDLVLSIDKFKGGEELFTDRQLELVVLPPKCSKHRTSSLTLGYDPQLRIYPSSNIYSNVEKTAKKFKAFKFINFVPHHMLSHLNKLVVITGFLCNGTPSIIVN